MIRTAVLKQTVQEDRADEYEGHIKEQLRRVVKGEPGTTLYGFYRRDPAGSGILPASRPDTREYFHFMSYVDEDAWNAHFEPEKDWWMPTFRSYMDAPMTAERFEPGNIVAGVSRDKVWHDGGIGNFAAFIFRIADDRAASFEAEAARQVAHVTENEPGTLLYTFFKRSGPSTMIPGGANGHTDYFHMMAYENDAAQELHRKFEFQTEGWAWGPVFKEHLAAPLVGERFVPANLVAAVTRAQSWTPA